MSKLKMLKFEAVALQNDGKALIEELQKLGVCQLEKNQDDRLFLSSTSETVATYEKSCDVINRSFSILTEYAIKTELGMLSGRRKIDKSEYDKKIQDINSILKIAYDIVECKRVSVESNAEILRLKTVIDSLRIWEKLDITLSGNNTKTCKVFVGTFPKQYSEETLMNELSVLVPEAVEYELEIVYSSKQISAVVVICHNCCEKEVYSALRTIGFTSPSETPSGTVAQRIVELEEKIKELKAVADECIGKIKAAAKSVPDLQLAYDYLSVMAEEYKNLANVGFSGVTVVLTGYLPEKCRSDFENLVEKHGGACILTEPSEDEDVPVALKNNGFCEPVEGITEMYALPGKKDVDPTSIMAFFYYLLFGMMLSDAGYGLVMTIGTAVILKKTGVEGSMRRMMKMFFYCGISTTIWGALFGSWFGDIVQVICTNFLGYEKGPNLALWFEPINDPIKLLLFSFIIGICHLFLGLCVLCYMKWKDGDKVGALFDTIPIMLAVLGAAPLAAGNFLLEKGTIPDKVMNVAAYVAIAGVVLIVLTGSRSSKNILLRLGGGLYGLYNVASGYLSDILSYSRLLALGLATGCIASVINMMGAMPENLVVKGIVLTVVFIIGHILNMAINVLGAYVHTNRLQFVELFGKFYEGGGKAFEPLKLKTKYIRFKEEN